MQRKRTGAATLLWLMLICLIFTGISGTVFADDIEEKYDVNVSVAGGTSKVGGNWVWTPGNQANNHQYSYRVSYNVRTADTLPKGAIDITIPLHVLFSDADTLTWADRLAMYIPDWKTATDDSTSSTISADVQMAYEIDLDTGVVHIRNFRDLTAPAEAKGYFEVGYLTTLPTYEYPDFGKDGNTGFAFETQLTVSNELKDTAVAEKTWIDTHAIVNGTNKQQPSLYTTWQDGWGTAIKPDDADNWYYLLWPVTSAVDATQYYTLTLDDVCGKVQYIAGTKGTGSDEMTVVGYFFARQKEYQSANSITDDHRQPH